MHADEHRLKEQSGVECAAYDAAVRSCVWTINSRHHQYVQSQHCYSTAVMALLWNSVTCIAMKALPTPCRQCTGAAKHADHAPAATVLRPGLLQRLTACIIAKLTTNRATTATAASHLRLARPTTSAMAAQNGSHVRALSPRKPVMPLLPCRWYGQLMTERQTQ